MQCGNIETVEVLLSNNADVTVTDVYEKNAIYCAAEENMLDVLKVGFWEKIPRKIGGVPRNSRRDKTKILCEILHYICLVFQASRVSVK